jgi:pilus assembly protein CpaF
LVVHIERLRDGRRIVANVTEVLGMEGEVISMQDVFKYDIRSDVIRPTGIRPLFADRLRDHGIVLPPAVFEVPS